MHQDPPTLTGFQSSYIPTMISRQPPPPSKLKHLDFLHHCTTCINSGQLTDLKPQLTVDCQPVIAVNLHSQSIVTSLQCGTTSIARVATGLQIRLPEVTVIMITVTETVFKQLADRCKLAIANLIKEFKLSSQLG